MLTRAPLERREPDARLDTDASAEGADAYFAEWRERELSRLVRQRVTYLDYTGAALYPESVVREDAVRLATSLFGNPHSEHAPSRASTSDVARARAAILDFVGASPDEYAVILTANASAACRLVGESFPFSTGSTLALSADNHNSVNGLRELARVRGAEVATIPLNRELRLADTTPVLGARGRAPSLFAFPAQSNFSGVRHPLALVREARERGWHVLLDAASFVPSCELRLDQIGADFVVLSLYKIAGYPSGVGALVARRSALALLRRPWFAGGTVHWVSVQHGRHRLLESEEAFEDGTPAYLAAGSVHAALAAVRGVGRERLARHLRALTSEALGALGALRHGDGSPVIRFHGPSDVERRGATIALSVHDRSGRAVPYWTVEEDARAASLAMRGGCFCNPGCAEAAFGLPAEETRACLEALGDSFTIPRFAACLGDRTVGAIRISLGLGSVRADVTRAVEFFSRYAG